MSNIFSTKLVFPDPLSPTKTKTFFVEEVVSRVSAAALSTAPEVTLALAISQRLLGAKLPSLALAGAAWAWLLGAAGFLSYCSLFRL
jgi:hypothetical protein